MASDQDAVETLSQDRLSGYEVRGLLNSDQDLLGRYLYNVALSTAMYPLLHALEVVLRNRVHNAVSATFPVNPKQPREFEEFPCWLDLSQPILGAGHQEMVGHAKIEVHKDLRKRRRARAGDRALWTPGRLVAKLTFAFWVFVFDEQYGTENAPGQLWPGLFGDVFPHRHGRVDSAMVRKRLRRLLVIRNRVMHHERIVPYQDAGSHIAPTTVRNEIIELISWMSPRAAAALENHGPFDVIFEDSYARCMQFIARRI